MRLNDDMLSILPAIVVMLAPIQSPGQGVVSKKLSAAKSGYYHANAEYLVFSKHRLAPIVNPVLKALATSAHREWVADADKAMKELGKPFAAWEHELSMHISYETSSMLTIGVVTYDYSGGAHPNHWIEFANFGVVGGKGRKLALKDFFIPGFDYAGHVSGLVVKKLKAEDGAEWVKNGDVKKLDAKMLERFTPDKGGMVWFFNPYEVGPYAAGDFEVKLTLKELGPKFRAALLK
jgi:hypothetical protein